MSGRAVPSMDPAVIGSSQDADDAGWSTQWSGPGSPAALARGCLCSVLANASYRVGQALTPVIDPRCPVHGADGPSDDTAGRLRAHHVYPERPDTGETDGDPAPPDTGSAAAT